MKDNFDLMFINIQILSILAYIFQLLLKIIKINN